GAAERAVGGGDRDHDEPGGPGHPAAGGADSAAGGADRPVHAARVGGAAGGGVRVPDGRGGGGRRGAGGVAGRAGGPRAEHVLAQYQSGAQTRRVEELNAAAPGPFVELHPRLADRLGVAEGELLAVTSRRGRAVAPARVTGTIRPDTVFMPFHWGGAGRANSL